MSMYIVDGAITTSSSIRQPEPKLPGGGYGGVIHPSHSGESSPRRAKDSKSSGQFLQIRTT